MCVSYCSNSASSQNPHAVAAQHHTMIFGTRLDLCSLNCESKELVIVSKPCVVDDTLNIPDAVCDVTLFRLKFYNRLTKILDILA